MAPRTPYSDLPPTAFWRTAVAEPGLWGLSGLWQSKWQLPSDARFATFGSCFAQHISRALLARGLNWLNAEPAPGRTPEALAQAYGYGVFSARTGNIYRAAQLLAQVELATGAIALDHWEIWEGEGGRKLDSMRPAIEPGGFVDETDLLASRLAMGRAFRRCLTDAEVLVFTLGLTEGWQNAATGQCYPLCPGTQGGQFDPDRQLFVNDSYPAVRTAMEAALSAIWALNPALRVLLTVSPVPLTATASGQHVLAATTWSKSVLRAVAGDLAAEDSRVDYFPSYEIITGAPTRSAFYEPNLRSVAPTGVATVMQHFFAGLDLGGAPIGHGLGETARAEALEEGMAQEDLVCEEMTLERFNNA